MALHNDIGKIGEDIAFSFLLENGYTILAKNYRKGRAEADIIAFFDKTIIVVEVKTRTYFPQNLPENAVTSKKQKKMMQAAVGFMQEFRYENELRFDIIAIDIENNNAKNIFHIKDAFFPVDGFN